MAGKNITRVEEDLKHLLENFSKDEFVFDFLLTYGTPKATIKRLKDGNLNLSKQPNQLV